MKKIVRESKWSRSSPSVIVLESKDGNASEESTARKKESDTHTTLRSLSETLQTTALPSLPLSSTWYLHATRGYNGYLLAYFWIFTRGILCTRHTLHEAYSAHAS